MHTICMVGVEELLYSHGGNPKLSIWYLFYHKILFWWVWLSQHLLSSFQKNLDQFREEILPFVDVSRTQIMIGDFNINLLKTPQNVLTSTLQQLGYRQLVMKPTHNQGGLIDHVYFFSPNNFVTCDLFKYHTVFWSDHTCQSLILKFSDKQL